MLGIKVDRGAKPRRSFANLTPTVTIAAPHPVINALECKACGRCVVACPKQVLSMSDQLNARGYHFVEYAGEGCTGCGNCFYTCPEPMALEVHIPQ